MDGQFQKLKKSLSKCNSCCYALGRNQPGHAWLAQHYKWAIDRIFLEKKHSHLIIAEDDMLFSPDFVAYFKQTAVLLERDPSLWRGPLLTRTPTTTFIKKRPPKPPPPPS